MVGRKIPKIFSGFIRIKIIPVVVFVLLDFGKSFRRSTFLVCIQGPPFRIRKNYFFLDELASSQGLWQIFVPEFYNGLSWI